MKKIIFLLLIILVTGCGQKKESISMSCDGIKSQFNVQKGDVVSCKLEDDVYKFNIDNIKNGTIYLTTESKISNQNKLELNDKELVINLDNGKVIIFYKE